MFIKLFILYTVSDARKQILSLGLRLPINFLSLIYLSFQFREERFRQTSESTNQRVLWWALAQTLILLVTGFWQMRHLKGFFEAKKLV